MFRIDLTFGENDVEAKHSRVCLRGLPVRMLRRLDSETRVSIVVLRLSLFHVYHCFMRMSMQPKTTDDDVEELCQAFGSIVSIKTVVDRKATTNTGNSHFYSCIHISLVITWSH